MLILPASERVPTSVGHHDRMIRVVQENDVLLAKMEVALQHHAHELARVADGQGGGTDWDLAELVTTNARKCVWLNTKIRTVEVQVPIKPPRHRHRDKRGHRKDRLPPWLWHRTRNAVVADPFDDDVEFANVLSEFRELDDTTPVNWVIGMVDNPLRAARGNLIEALRLRVDEIVLTSDVDDWDDIVNIATSSRDLRRVDHADNLYDPTNINSDDGSLNDDADQLLRKLYISDHHPTVYDLLTGLGKQLDPNVARLFMYNTARARLPPYETSLRLLRSSTIPDGLCYSACVSGFYRILLVAQFGRLPMYRAFMNSATLQTLIEAGLTNNIKVTSQVGINGVIWHFEPSDNGAPIASLMSGEYKAADRIGLTTLRRTTPVQLRREMYAHLQIIVGIPTVILWIVAQCLRAVAILGLHIVHATNEILYRHTQQCREEGFCYRELIDFNCGPSPPIAIWIAMTMLATPTNAKVKVFVSGDRVHIMKDRHGLLAHQVVNEMRNGRVTCDVTGTIHPVDVHMIIGAASDTSIERSNAKSFGKLVLRARKRPKLSKRMAENFVQLQRATTVMSMAFLLFIVCSESIISTVSRVKMTVTGKCYQLIADVQCGTYPRIKDFIARATRIDACQGRVKLTLNGSILHVTKDSYGPTAIQVLQELRQGYFYAQGRKYEVNDYFLIGGKEDDLRGKIGSGLSSFVGAFATGGLIAGAIATTTRLRPDWFGECYKLLYDVELGSKPLVTDFLAATRDLSLAYPSDELWVTFENDVVHLSYDSGSWKGSVVEIDTSLRDGLVPGYTSTLQPSTRIGYQRDSVWLSIAMVSALIAYPLYTLFVSSGALAVILFAMTAEYDIDDEIVKRHGRCYLRLADVPMGEFPGAISWAQQVPDSKIKDGTFKLIGNRAMLHAIPAKDGRSASAIISELRIGLAKVDGEVLPLEPETVIGGELPEEGKRMCVIGLTLIAQGFAFGLIYATLSWIWVKPDSETNQANAQIELLRHTLNASFCWMVLWVLYVMNIPRQPFSAKILTYGSRGDKMTPLYVMHHSAKKGLDVTVQDLTPGDAGLKVISAVEEGRHDVAMAHMFSNLDQFDEEPGQVTFAPKFSAFMPGVITYSANTIRQWRQQMQLTNVMWLDSMIDSFWANVDVQIESKKGCVPRSPDGRNAIVPRPNTGKRTLLLALGSSNIPEPEGLDPVTTWSTKRGTRYKFEHRVNHNEIFSDYESVWHHGGASTDRMALACGCKVKVLSDAIDRRLVKGRFNDVVFNNDWFTWWTLGFRSMNWQQKRTAIEPLLAAAPAAHRFTLLRCYFLSTVFLTCKISATTIGVLLQVTYATWTTKSAIGVLTFLLLGTRSKSIGYYMVRSIVRWVTRKMWRTGFKQLPRACRYMAHLHREAIIHGDIYDTVANVVHLGSGGYAICVVLITWGARYAYRILSCIANMYLFLQYGFFASQDTIKPGNIYLSVVKMHTDLIGDAFKMRHVQLINGSTGECLSLTMNSELKVVVSTNAHIPARDEAYIRLPFMSIEAWDRNVERMMAKNGSLYGPWNNCQTNTTTLMASTLFSEFEKLDTTQKMLSVTIALLMVLMTMYSIVLMFVFGIGVFLVICASAFDDHLEPIADSLMPRIAFAGAVVDAMDLTPYALMTKSILCLLDGPLPITRTHKYPTTQPYNCAMKPISLRPMSVAVRGKAKWYVQPCTGMNRNCYTLHRDYRVFKNLHNITDKGLDSNTTNRQKDLINEFRAKIKRMKLNGLVAILATTAERPIQQRVLDLIQNSCDNFVVISNVELEYTNMVVMNATGRECASLRLACPELRGVKWVSLNSGYGLNVFNATKKLMNVARCPGNIYVSNYGLNPGPAGLAAYKKPIIDEHAIDLNIYGSDEVAISRSEGTVYVEDNLALFTSLRKDLDLECHRKVVLYDKHTLENRLSFNVRRWNHEEIIPQLNNRCNWDSEIAIGPRGMTVGDDEMPLNEVVSDMYNEGTPIETVVTDAQVNTIGFAKKLGSLAEVSLKNAKTSPITSTVAAAFYKVTDTFKFADREGPKRMWAPVHAEITKQRSEEIKCGLHPNPVFVPASFKSTLAHYVKHLNMAQNKRDAILSPTVYRRRVNRNPYVDTYLSETLPDAYNKGVDASVLATKEVMLESLARYNKGGFVDAMTDKDITQITEAIYKQNRDMFDDARVADPFKLTKKFLSYKKYSAGLPFTYQHSGIKNRADLRKAGWLKPIAELGLLPYKTGEWFPAIAHAFPKSQVVSADKIFRNPAKMRSIVATAGFNNVQQGVLNFDLNNRHDFMGSHEKVAMPLLGSYMNYVFQDLEKYQYAFSFDVTAMDANLSDGILQVVANLRKKGFDNHPAKDILCKHVDCAMEQTKHSYVINLIDASVEELDSNDKLSQRVREWSAGKGSWAIKDPVAPGGILAKHHGGSTGDSNVTFNNTKGLPIILMYCYCKATASPYSTFFDRVALHNFGDDDVLAMNDSPQIARKMVQIAKQDLGLTVRFEAQGTNVVDQVFLGKRPVPSERYYSDFQKAGITAPKYAILNDGDVIRMRFAREKAEMSRHKGTRHELYRLEKAMGYALLTAHQPDLYEMVSDYFNEVKRRIPEEMVAKAWFKKKYRLATYRDVVIKWYRPLRESDFKGVHALQFQVSLVSKTEQAFVRVCRALGFVMDYFPAHLVASDQTANAYRVTELYTGVFEAHMWHHMVDRHGEPPTADELQAELNKTPYAQYTNAHHWMATYGCTLPTAGPLFERNFAHATWMLIAYTYLYIKSNDCVHILNRVPYGNVAVELFNLHVYKCRKWFGTMSYANYVARGANNPAIDGLMPKDPYTYHKRVALIVHSALPNIDVLGYIPIHRIIKKAAIALDVFAKVQNMSMATAGDAGNRSNPDAWHKALEDAKLVMKSGATPLIVAHTGTGKTRDLPGLIMADRDLKPTQVIVVMPRVIICESWSSVSGAVFKKRGQTSKSPLMTCTYGYLNHCLANNAKWWDDNAIFLFDEAHEESSDWYQLRQTFLGKGRAIAMTATPEAPACTGMTVITVNIEPRHKIVDTKIRSIEEGINDFMPKCTRALIIEPSKTKCYQIANNLLATGYPVKVVHAGDRSIPEGVHIVATSVIESSITIPGCDLVIDSGDRYVNDGGTLKRVPNDKPGMTQRRGRTGRTNPGEYLYVTTPLNTSYKPVPDINSVLQKSPAISSLRYVVPFDRTNGHRALVGDKFAKIQGIVPEHKDAISLIQIMMNMKLSIADMRTYYEKLRTGRRVEMFEHIMMTGLYDVSCMKDFSTEMVNYHRGRISYNIDGKPSGNVAIIKDYKVQTMTSYIKKEAWAESQIEQDTRTPKKRKNKSGRRRPKKSERESLG